MAQTGGVESPPVDLPGSLAPLRPGSRGALPAERDMTPRDFVVDESEEAPSEIQAIGSVLPDRVEDVAEHRMHAERYVLPAEAADAIAACRRRGGRVFAVGTTVVRTLEHRGREGGLVEAGEGSCDLFIYPGYEFGVVDGMITNFHLPQSTLLMLVSAFAGRERVLAAYAEAVRAGYRFFSYGDAMMMR